MTPKTAELAPQADEIVSETPTVDQIVDQMVADTEKSYFGRINVFKECVRNGAVSVTTEAQASEIARMITSAEAEVERARAIASAMISRAEQRVKSLEFLFMMPLEAWTSAKLAGKKTRSLILEGGKLALRKIPESTRYVDQAATLEWAQAFHPAAVEMKPSLKTDAVKEWEKANGQAAPGRERTPEHDSFSVSVPK